MLRSCLSGKAEELAELEKNEKSSRRSSEIDIKPGTSVYAVNLSDFVPSLLSL